MDLNIIKSEIFAQKLTYESISDLIMKGLNRNPIKNFIIDCIRERQWTRRQVLDSCLNFAYYLINDCKLSKGDVVCFVAYGSDNLVIAMLGVLLAGAVFTTKPVFFTQSEIQLNLKVIEPSVVVCDEEYYDFVMNCDTGNKNIFLTEHAQARASVLSLDMIFKMERQPHIALPVIRSLDDMAAIQMTSGSTGSPKYVIKTNANLLWNVKDMNASADTSAGAHAIGMVRLVFNQHACNEVFRALDIAGAQVAIVSKDFEHLYENIHRWGITSVYLSPAPLVNFLRYCTTRDRRHLDSVLVVTTAGEATPPAAYDYIRDNYNIKYVLNDYGLSETGPATSLYVRDSSQYSTVGKPIPNTEMKIIDDSDNSLPANTTGEICIRSGRVCPGYLNNTPEEKARLFTSDGFFRTGDIGYYDSNHDFYIVSRINEVFKVFGAKVAPVELENILRTHCDVSMAAVIGIANAELGKVPLAFVTLVKGAKVTVDELIEYVNSRVSDLKRLRGGLRVLDTFPMTESEKINKTALKGMA